MRVQRMAAGVGMAVLLVGCTVRVSVDTNGGDPRDTDDIIVPRLRLGVTSRASVDSGGGNTNDPSTTPDISADGHVVAFASLASDLVQGDTNGFPDVFVRNLVAGTTTRVSVD